mgnify:CR=1 FL=1
MRVLQILNHRKFFIVSFILFLYVMLNLIDGERGLISFYKKQKIKEQLIQEKTLLTKQLALIEKKNSLLSDSLDLDYLETIIRKKFMVGKENEKIYTIK